MSNEIDFSLYESMLDIIIEKTNKKLIKWKMIWNDPNMRDVFRAVIDQNNYVLEIVIGKYNGYNLTIVELKSRKLIEIKFNDFENRFQNKLRELYSLILFSDTSTGVNEIVEILSDIN